MNKKKGEKGCLLGFVYLFTYYTCNMRTICRLGKTIKAREKSRKKYHEKIKRIFEVLF